jgi:putative Holliday junction resolvase
MSKIIALDLGERWTGIAISDATRMVARPVTTVKRAELMIALAEVIKRERITTVVVGMPLTLKGTESAQTLTTKQALEDFKQAMPEITWVAWDERLSSKRAQALKSPKTPEEKLKAHAVAAAFILESYLHFLRLHAGE